MGISTEDPFFSRVVESERERERGFAMYACIKVLGLLRLHFYC